VTGIPQKSAGGLRATLNAALSLPGGALSSRACGRLGGYGGGRVHGHRAWSRSAYTHGRRACSHSGYSRRGHNIRGHNIHGDMHAYDVCGGRQQRSRVLAVARYGLALCLRTMSNLCLGIDEEI
jgi:hypothetical protein